MSAARSIPWPIEVDLSRAVVRGDQTSGAKKARTQTSSTRVRSRARTQPCSGCGRPSKGAKSCSRQCRFDAFVLPEPNSGCHLWIGNLNHRGYGLFKDGMTRKATHVALELDGRAAPKHERGEVCMHLCDTPACVNPRHLRVGSTLENVKDRDSKERACRGSRCHRSRLSEADVLAVLESMESYAALARRLGVSANSIRAIRRGKSWKHLPRTPSRRSPGIRQSKASHEGEERLSR